MLIYTVESGDTVNRIASTYGVSRERIITDNGLIPPYNLTVGQALVIKFPRVVHTVAAGETLEIIAAGYGTTVRVLLQNNPNLIGREYLTEGEQITVSFIEEKMGNINVDGYAYTYINRDVLINALPFLSSLTIFGYGFTESGELIEPDDEEMIALAEEYSVAPIMLISSLTESGTFSNERVAEILSNPAVRENAIENILNTMLEKGYLGINVDFEFIQAENTDNYIEFIRQLGERLSPYGFTVNTDLAPKTSAQQVGLLYESHDYRRIGEVSDTVLLMTYEWGYVYGPPMAIAPLNKVTEVVNYALTEIPPEKIYLGIPTYSYDWTLPFEKGVSKAETFGSAEAVILADRVGAEIMFDETAQSPYFVYTDEEGRTHEVWFEDARSIDAKLRLVDSNNLHGTGYWNIMRRFPQNYAVLSSLFNILPGIME